MMKKNALLIPAVLMSAIILALTGGCPGTTILPTATFTITNNTGQDIISITSQVDGESWSANVLTGGSVLGAGVTQAYEIPVASMGSSAGTTIRFESSTTYWSTYGPYSEGNSYTFPSFDPFTSGPL